MPRKDIKGGAGKILFGEGLDSSQAEGLDLEGKGESKKQ
jgi:hypothetical protein